MKIAILTQPLHTNYGGILQAYAVQKILRDMGHDVVTLDARCKPRKKLSPFVQFRTFVATMIRWLLGRIQIKDIFWPCNNSLRNRMLIQASMNAFISKILKLSPIIQTDDDIKKYVEEQGFDAFVVGSDQVWRPIYSPNIGWFFLNFLAEESRVRRIAFSASFGTSDWEFSKELTDYLKPFAKKFDAISVRETSGVDLCKKYLDVQAIQVLDPTMMLTVEDYVKLVNMDKSNTQSVDNFIFSYVLDDDENKQKMIEDISKILQYPILSFSERGSYGPYASKRKALKQAPKPVAQWLRGFQEAECVVTDSFHGTVFSILHHRPFVVVANNGRGIARIETLLRTFGLEERLVESTTDFEKEWLLSGIYWDNVDVILNKKREYFKDFIDMSLNN